METKTKRRWIHQIDRKKLKNPDHFLNLLFSLARHQLGCAAAAISICRNADRLVCAMRKGDIFQFFWKQQQHAKREKNHIDRKEIKLHSPDVIVRDSKIRQRKKKTKSFFRYLNSLLRKIKADGNEKVYREKGGFLLFQMRVIVSDAEGIGRRM